MQERVYQRAIHVVNNLKQCSLEVWNGMDRIIDGAVAQWRQHLHGCVQAEGRHFEHLFNLNNQTIGLQLRVSSQNIKTVFALEVISNKSVKIFCKPKFR
jgi:hypothetical protein